MQLFVGGFGKAYGIIGDNSRFLEVSRDNFPYSHLLLAHFEDIPLSNGVFFSGQTLDYKPERTLHQSLLLLVSDWDQLIVVIASNQPEDGVLHALIGTLGKTVHALVNEDQLVLIF